MNLDTTISPQEETQDQAPIHRKNKTAKAPPTSALATSDAVTSATSSAMNKKTALTNRAVQHPAHSVTSMATKKKTATKRKEVSLKLNSTRHSLHRYCRISLLPKSRTSSLEGG